MLTCRFIEADSFGKKGRPILVTAQAIGCISLPPLINPQCARELRYVTDIQSPPRGHHTLKKASSVSFEGGRSGIRLFPDSTPQRKMLASYDTLFWFYKWILSVPLSNLGLNCSCLTSGRSRKRGCHNNLPISPVFPLVDKRVRSVLTLRQVARDVRSAQRQIIKIIGPVRLGGLFLAAHHPEQPTTLHLSSAHWWEDGAKSTPTIPKPNSASYPRPKRTR